jgi:hypothetical protein
MVEAQELKDFRWEKRLVVGVVDDPVFLAKLKKEISKQSAGVRDRKLFFLIHSNALINTNLSTRTCECAFLRYLLNRLLSYGVAG